MMGKIGNPAMSGVVIAIVVAQKFSVEDAFCYVAEGKVAFLR